MGYQVDYLVSGCDAALSDYGFYTSDVSLANLEQKSLSIAAHAAIIADSSKFGRRALTRFAALQDIDLLISDSKLESEIRKHLENSGVKVVLVP